MDREKDPKNENENQNGHSVLDKFTQYKLLLKSRLSDIEEENKKYTILVDNKFEGNQYRITILLLFVTSVLFSS